uniref:Uncharacterized protein n=1 Tax=Picea glauca TaxID=3330 RepID=A0A124GNT5_PICGL|nr:hypothetical protein ABT39_MTgene3048 [Picea glauca]
MPPLSTLSCFNLVYFRFVYFRFDMAFQTLCPYESLLISIYIYSYRTPQLLYVASTSGGSY